MSILKKLPRVLGLRKEWEHNTMTTDSTGELMRRNYADPAWGDPVEAEAWFDDDGNLKVCRAVYSNGGLAILKQKSRALHMSIATIDLAAL